MKLFDKIFSMIALAILAILGVFTTLLWGKIDNLILDNNDHQREISSLKREQEYHLLDEAKNPSSQTDAQKQVLNNLTIELRKKSSEISDLEKELKLLQNQSHDTKELAKILEKKDKEITALQEKINAFPAPLSQDQKMQIALTSRELKEKTSENIRLKEKLFLQKSEQNRIDELEEKIANYEKKHNGIKIIQPKSATIQYQKQWTLSHNVLFHLGQSRLTPKGLQALRNISGELAKLQKRYGNNKNFIIEIAGHADNIKVKAPNLTNRYLSAKRALVVVNFLEKHGIDPKYLVASAWGEHHPRSQKAAENRRIEILVSY